MSNSGPINYDCEQWGVGLGRSWIGMLCPGLFAERQRSAYLIYFFFKLINLFSFGCVGSSLMHVGFL